VEEENLYEGTHQDMSSAFQLDAVDPVARQAAELIVKRSNEGAIEYKSESILEREGVTAHSLMEDAIEEAVDQVIYLLALKAKLSTPRSM